MTLRRPHVTPGDEPLQVAFLIAGKLGQVKLPDVTKQRYLGVRQVVDNSMVSGSLLASWRMRAMISRNCGPAIGPAPVDFLESKIGINRFPRRLSAVTAPPH